MTCRSALQFKYAINYIGMYAFRMDLTDAFKFPGETALEMPNQQIRECFI